MTDVFTSHLDFISTRESQESNEILLKRCFITKSLMHARMHPHTGEFSGFFKRKFHSFRHLLGGDKHRMEKMGLFWFEVYTVSAFSFKSRQVSQIFSHSRINSLPHIFTS